MGRHRNSRKNNNFTPSIRVGRDHVYSPPIARRRLPPLTQYKNLTVFEDRRTSWPDSYRPAFAQPRMAAQLVIGHPNVNVHTRRFKNKLITGGFHEIGRREVSKPLTDRVAFAVPKSVAVCVRRSRRREVLHALGVAGGKGVGRNIKHHRNEWSEIGC